MKNSASTSSNVIVCFLIMIKCLSKTTFMENKKIKNLFVFFLCIAIAV